MKSTRLVSLMIALACFACRGDDDDGGDDTGDDTADDVADDASDDASDDGGDAVTIYDVQSDEMAVGTPVELSGVIVTAVDTFGGRTGGVYVQEPDGGPFSGVLVFVRGTEGAELVPGDIVDVVGGVKDEFSFDEDPGSLTEIAAPDGGAIVITKTGSGEVPAPEVVDPIALSADDAESEKWEGVLVEFENVRVNVAPEGVSSSDPSLLEMAVTGPYAVQGGLIDLAGIAAGTCYSSIVGIGDYFFTYKIQPRSADDLVTGADGDCLPPEDDEALCGDEMDNDYDGQTDCQDAACIESVAACAPEELSIEQIRTGAAADGDRVTLTDVVVVGVSAPDEKGEPTNRNFWVQDAAAGALNGGIVVFWPEESSQGPLPENIVVGATLTFDATVDEFPCLDDSCSDNPLIQLTFASVPEVGAAATPVPLAAELADIANDPDAIPYLGTLVTIADVAVVTPPNQFGVFTVGDGTDELTVEEDIFEHEAAEDECYAFLTGVAYRSIFDGRLILLPRSAEDVVTGPCP